MSAGWDAYVKNLLDSEECIKKAAIIGASDGCVWAKSDGASLGENFSANDDELRTLSSQFNSIGNVPSTGVVLEKTKYIVPYVEDVLIFGKKDAQGVFAVKTNQAIVIVTYNGDNSKGIAARKGVERVAQYLRDQGY